MKEMISNRDGIQTKKETLYGIVIKFKPCTSDIILENIHSGKLVSAPFNLFEKMVTTGKKHFNMIKIIKRS